MNTEEETNISQEELMRKSMQEANFSEDLISIFIKCILDDNDD